MPLPTPQASVSVQTADFDLSKEVARLREGDAGIGAVATFVGTVRELAQGQALEAMEIEHYPGMTEPSIVAMIEAAQQRFQVAGVRVVHRVGRLTPQSQIMMVAVASAHRSAAFEACEFLMDYLKTRAPFWKKEITAAGARWVEARASDEAAAARWTDPNRQGSST